MSGYVLAFAVFTVFFLLTYRRVPFAVSVAVFLSGVFLFYAKNPAELILDESLLRSSLKEEHSIKTLFKGLIAGVVGFSAIFFADLFSSIISNYFSSKTPLNSLKNFGFFLGVSLFLSYGGVPLVWELCASSKLNLSNIVFLREIIIPLGSLLFLSSLTASISIFFVSIGLDFLYLFIKRILDYDFGIGSYQSVRLSVLVLFLSSTFYVFSSELSEILLSADKYLDRR